MDSRKAILARLREAAERRDRYGTLYRSLLMRDFSTVYPLVFADIRDRFLLTPAMCPGEDLLDLADASLRYVLALRRQGIDAGEIARSCAGASSVISKKIMLIRALQRDFSFTITPEQFAEISTVTELTDHILIHGQAADIQPVEERSSGERFDADALRRDYPALGETVNGRPLIYLDNAATAQMPLLVMDAMRAVELARGNIHRGVHTLAERTTGAYEGGRRTCADFLGAAPEQIVFTAGATDGINRVASALPHFSGGVVTTALEHHSNFVPWQQACRRLGRSFRVCPLHGDGSLDWEALDRLLDGDISILAVGHVSNVTGGTLPVRELCALAHSRGIRVLVDGAQSACHMKINVKELGCDWFVCSGHKLGGPFGIGLLYCREPMPPVRFGGGMVDRVTEEETTFVPPPHVGEAGTPPVSGAVGLAAAIEYRRALPAGWQDHEANLLRRAEVQLRELPGVTILGGGDKTGCLSFVIDGVQPLEAAAMLDACGVALRSGDFCAQPLMAALGIPYALRVSPAFYNTEGEIDAFLRELRRIIPLLRAPSGA